MEEIWKDVIGYEGLYQISNTGKVKSLDRKSICGEINYGRMVSGKMLKSREDCKYLRIQLVKNKTSKHFLIHRLVAIAFIDNPYEKRIVNHKDGNRYNNFADNLEWCNREENELHALANGLKARGERAFGAKLKKDDVIQIKKMLKAGIAQKSIAEKFNVSKSNISLINIKYNWAWLEV